MIFQVCTDKVTYYFGKNKTNMAKKLSLMFLLRN